MTSGPAVRVPGLDVSGFQRELEALRPRKDAWYASTADQRSALWQVACAKRDEALSRMLTQGSEAAGVRSPPGWREEIAAYARRCDWTLLDAVALGVALDADPEAVAEALAAPYLVYHSLRMVDDVIDRHVDYKGGEPTAWGTFRSQHGERADSLVLLPALLMLVEHVPRLPVTLGDSVLQTIWGAIGELEGSGISDLPAYRRMVAGKMVSYSHLIYEPFTRSATGPIRDGLWHFLDTSFYVGQLANDLYDRRDDAQRGQPNVWNPPLPAGGGVDELKRGFATLRELTPALGSQVEGYAISRRVDLLAYLLRPIQRATGLSS